MHSPPPDELLKAMERKWAECLVNSGAMRFGCVQYYRTWEDTVLGDLNDGESMFMVNGRPHTIDSVNPIYVWCTSRPSISAKRLRLLAKHGHYDCVVRIHSPITLFRRVHLALQGRADVGALIPHFGHVTYNRGANADQKTLNSQEFSFHVFQKAPSFSEDREYRLSLRDAGLRSRRRRFLKLQVGPCHDIMAITGLPDSNA